MRFLVLNNRFSGLKELIFSLVLWANHRCCNGKKQLLLTNNNSVKIDSDEGATETLVLF